MIVRLTELKRRRVATADGAPLGRLIDVVVRLDAPAPRIVRLRVRRGRRVSEIDAGLIRQLGHEPVVADPGRLVRPRLADDELLLDRHVLDAQIFDFAGKRITRGGDVELELDRLAVEGVSIGLGPIFGRLGLDRFAKRATTERLAWRDLHLTSRRGHSLMLDSSAAAVHRARPDALSQLVAHLPHRHAHELHEAVAPETAESVRRAPSPRAPRFPFCWIRRHASP